MKKTPKKSNLSPLQSKVVESLKKQTGWEEVKLGVQEDFVLDKGQIIHKFTASHPKLLNLPTQSIFVDQKAKVVDFKSLVKEKELLPLDRSALMKEVGKPADPRQHSCEKISDAVDRHLNNFCDRKFNALSHFDEADECGCKGKSSKSQKVDLIILIDTSGSMSTKGEAISTAAEIALRDLKCQTDLEVTWLGIASSFPGTKFTGTSRDYLLANGTCNSLQTPKPGSPPSPEEKEEGTRTIIDLSNCFNWRKGACRAIFYISDEPIHRGNTDMANDDMFTNLAIDAALKNNVTIFSHYIKKAIPEPIKPNDQRNYCRLSEDTGGMSFINLKSESKDYVALLNQVVCNACGSCKKVDWTKVEPCISVSWGDSDCDCIESNDFETLCISVCNCYSNIRFEDFKIGYLYLTDENGRSIPNLPDGTPSIEILPLGPICFGDLSPCLDNNPTCISREVVLRTRGAKAGKYKLQLGSICYKASYQFAMEESFALNICKD